MEQIEKNKAIGDARRATAMKRKFQTCKTFKFKINRSSLNKLQKEQIKMIFVEAKWIYNYLLSHTDGLFDIKTKYKELNKITHLDKDRNEIDVDIKYLGSSIKQEMIQRICNQIKGLSTLKKRGHTVGSLKYKSEINSIPLKQYSITHFIRGNKFKIQGIKKDIRVSGLKQLSKYNNIDYANAKLLYDGYDYFISLTCYFDKENVNRTYSNKLLGIDMGINTTITCSNSDKIDVLVGESERLNKLQARLAKKVKHSNGWYKTISLIRKEYAHINNIKNDKANKIVSKLLSENELIIIQDEQISAWHSEEHMSNKVQHSILGRVKYKLMNSDRVVVLDKWFPTTKFCSNCYTKIDIGLDERTFACPNCGTIEDRDIHAANNMIYFYQRYKDEAGTVCTSKLERIKFDNKFAVKPENTTSLALC